MKRDQKVLAKLVDEGRACERRIAAALNYEDPTWRVTYSYASPGISGRMARTYEVSAATREDAVRSGLGRVPSYASDGRVDSVEKV